MTRQHHRNSADRHFSPNKIRLKIRGRNPPDPVCRKEEREKSVKKTVILKSLSPSGLYDIQQALNTTQAEIHYLGSSVFSVVVKDTDFKRANTKMSQILKEIEDRVKKHTLKLEIK